MSCPHWCGTEYPHAVLHFGRVALLRNASGDVSVAVCQVAGRPVEVAVTVYDPGMGTPAPVNDEPSGLTPTAARTLGQALTARGRDTELGELLIRAADLAEGGGHAAALSDAQLDGTACVRCHAAEGPMVPAGHGPRGQLFECTHHQAEAGGEA